MDPLLYSPPRLFSTYVNSSALVNTNIQNTAHIIRDIRRELTLSLDPFFLSTATIVKLKGLATERTKHTVRRPRLGLSVIIQTFMLIKEF